MGIFQPMTLRAQIEAIPAADLPDAYSQHPDLIWREDVLTLLDAEPEQPKASPPDTTGPPWWCETCASWRHSMPCGRDECPTPDAEPEQGWQESKLREAVQEYLDWGAMTGSDRDWFEGKFRDALASPPRPSSPAAEEQRGSRAWQPKGKAK